MNIQDILAQLYSTKTIKVPEKRIVVKQKTIRVTPKVLQANAIRDKQK